jgi:tetratricopeptide (TPR) repeat protein
LAGTLAVGFCAAGCERLISISSIPGGNPAALAEPDAWAIYYFACADCGHLVCDRCAAQAQGLLQHLTCPSCGGTRLDAAGPGSGEGGYPGERPEPTPAERARDRGLDFDRAGDHAAAAEAFTEALRHDPRDAWSWSLAAAALSRAGRLEEALTAYENFTRLRPESADGELGRAATLTDLGRYSAALVAYDRAISLQPTQPKAHVGRAMALSKVGRYEEALAALAQAAAFDDGSLDYYRHSLAGLVLLGLHRDREALAEIDTALRLRPNAPSDLRNRQIALTRLGPAG